MDRRIRPNQFSPSTSSKLGAEECINVQVMSLTSSIFMTIDHLTFKCDLDLQPTIFFHKESKTKKKIFFFFWGGGGGGWAGDRRTCSNQSAPSTSFCP